MEIYRGQVLAYDATNHKADVALVGSMSGVVRGMPVAHHVGPEVMTADRSCGVVFFGESDDGLVIATFDGVPPAWVTSALIKDGEVAVGDLDFDPATQAELDAHMAGAHLNLDEYGPTLNIYNFINCWTDHFLGDSLAPEYTANPDSGCSVAIWGSVIHGWVRLNCSATAWRRARLWLGNDADGYATLDVDNGWLQLARGYFNNLFKIDFSFGVSDAASSNVVRAGYAWAGGPNWGIIMNDGGGGFTYAQSGVAADTGIHRHALKAYAVDGVVHLDYWLDSVLLVSIDSDSYDIPTMGLTPILYVQTRESVSKVGRFDHWAVMPSN